MYCKKCKRIAISPSIVISVSYCITSFVCSVDMRPVSNVLCCIYISTLLVFVVFMQVFDGNCDHFTPVINRFNPVKARFVKVLPHDNPQSWTCMRLELYGCDS